MTRQRGGEQTYNSYDRRDLGRTAWKWTPWFGYFLTTSVFWCSAGGAACNRCGTWRARTWWTTTTHWDDVPVLRHSLGTVAAAANSRHRPLPPLALIIDLEESLNVRYPGCSHSGYT